MNEHFTFHAEKNTLFQGKVLSWLLKKKKKRDQAWIVFPSIITFPREQMFFSLSLLICHDNSSLKYSPTSSLILFSASRECTFVRSRSEQVWDWLHPNPHLNPTFSSRWVMPQLQTADWETSNCQEDGAFWCLESDQTALPSNALLHAQRTFYYYY